MFKVGYLIDDEWREHSHPPVFKLVKSDPESAKVITTAPGGDPLIFRLLSDRLSPPLVLLYVLHTPRGEGRPGRYQSCELTHAEIGRFLDRFASFLQSDARFDLWVHSLTDSATIVWDRHNLIHAYGMPHRFVEALRSTGFHEGDPAIPAPHEHHYHAAFDRDATALMSFCDWQETPLQPGDEQ